MRRLRRIGALFSQDALGYWHEARLYVLLLVVWSASTIWRVVSGSLLETPDNTPTLIKIDLLEAVAFLAAWSLLLITLTTKVVNKGRDLEFGISEMKADMGRDREGHLATKAEVEKMLAEVSCLAESVSQVMEEVERVTKENEQ